MLRKWLFLLAAGTIGATLSVWLLDDWVWGHLFNYSHGHGDGLSGSSGSAASGNSRRAALGATKTCRKICVLVEPPLDLVSPWLGCGAEPA